MGSNRTTAPGEHAHLHERFQRTADGRVRDAGNAFSDVVAGFVSRRAVGPTHDGFHSDSALPAQQRPRWWHSDSKRCYRSRFSTAFTARLRMAVCTTHHGLANRALLAQPADGHSAHQRSSRRGARTNAGTINPRFPVLEVVPERKRPQHTQLAQPGTFRLGMEVHA